MGIEGVMIPQVDSLFFVGAGLAVYQKTFGDHKRSRPVGVAVMRQT